MATYNYYLRTYPFRMTNGRLIQMILGSYTETNYSHYRIKLRTDDTSLSLNNVNSSVQIYGTDFASETGSYTVSKKLGWTANGSTSFEPIIYYNDGGVVDELFWLNSHGSQSSPDDGSLTVNGVLLGDVSMGYDSNTSILGYADFTGKTSAFNSEVVTTSGATITNTVPTKTGYTFTGWSNNVNSTIYQPGATIPWSVFNTAKDSPAIILTPVFTINSYDITFNPNGGTPSPASITREHGSTLGTLPVVTRQYYTLDAWRNNSLLVTPYTVVTDDMDLVAYWRYTVYNIVLDSLGGIESSYSFYISQEASLSEYYPDGLPIPTKDGYVFVQWETEDGVAIDIDTVPGNDMTYYAKWDILEVTVTFDSQGGTVPDPVILESGNTLSTIPSSFKEGYILLGWYDNLEYTGDPLSLDTIIDNNITYYAQWEEYVVPSRVYVLHDGIYREGMVYVKDNDVYVESDIYIKDGIYKRGVRKE